MPPATMLCAQLLVRVGGAVSRACSPPTSNLEVPGRASKQLDQILTCYCAGVTRTGVGSAATSAMRDPCMSTCGAGTAALGFLTLVFIMTTSTLTPTSLQTRRKVTVNVGNKPKSSIWLKLPTENKHNYS